MYLETSQVCGINGNKLLSASTLLLLYSATSARCCNVLNITIEEEEGQLHPSQFVKDRNLHTSFFGFCHTLSNAQMSIRGADAPALLKTFSC